ncbi:MAG: Asp/Glu racemase [Desulfobacula sp.]|uniref:maleate cis-trans isomerase family protein n=1 Tax=Desulfobacula sp. TaxID=2593537 RepID=UPI0039B84C7C|nr:Asp/Glu racemase [Desulfobacula sp.]
MTTKQEFEALEIHLNYSKSSRPDKVHIGLVQLSTDHSLEVDWTKLSGSSAMVFSSRVYYSSIMTSKALNDISQGITAAADLIAVGLPMDVMAFGCTSASMVIGSKKIEELLTIHHPGIPATNPWAAAKAAFRHLNTEKISIFSPYPTEVNYPLYQELRAEGFDIPAIGALRIQNDTDITTVSLDSMVKGVEKILDHAKTDALFMSCTNLRILDHLEKLESIFDIPIICSNQAMFWHAMTLAGKPPDCKGFGRLFNNQSY